MASLLAIKTDEHNALVEKRAALMAQAEEAGSFDGVREEIDQIDADLPVIQADLERIERDRAKARKAPAAMPMGSLTPGQEQEGPVTPVGGFKPLAGPLSQQFLESEAWQQYLAERAPSGQFGHKSRVDSPKISIEGSVLAGLGRRRPTGALITGGSSTSAGAFIVADDTGIFDEGPFQKIISVLDLITRGTTDSDTVEFVRTTGFTNNAATVAEAASIDPQNNTGRKPQSALAFERVAPGVKIIAHGVPATKNALADAGQMRTILDQFLRYGIREELADQVVNGAGAGEDFNGILDVATGSQAFDTDLATTLRRAKTKVRTGGKARATGILLNPADAEQLDIDLLNDAASYYRAATITELASIWGLPIVEDESIAAGTGVVGDFRTCVLWDRQQTTIEATQGYLDFFMKNLVMVLAEMRAAFGILRPSALVVADLAS